MAVAKLRSIALSYNQVRKFGRVTSLAMGDFRFLSNILKMETTDAVFDAMKCNELKTYLKKHGQLTSGTKKELIRTESPPLI